MGILGETPRKFYFPSRGDIVVGVVRKRLADFYRVNVGAAKDGLLPVTAFNGATKQNAPSLDVGSIVVAGVANADIDHELMLSCMAADEVKSWSSNECYLGPLLGGLMFRLPIPLSNLLLHKDNAILHLLGQKLAYEIAVGQNGHCWINTRHIRDTAVARNIIEQCLNKKFSSFDDLSVFMDEACSELGS